MRGRRNLTFGSTRRAVRRLRQLGDEAGYLYSDGQADKFQVNFLGASQGRCSRVLWGSVRFRGAGESAHVVQHGSLDVLSFRSFISPSLGWCSACHQQLVANHLLHSSSSFPWPVQTPPDAPSARPHPNIYINSPRVALVRPLVSIPLPTPRPCKRADYSTWASMSQPASSHHGAGCPGVRRDHVDVRLIIEMVRHWMGVGQCRACPDTSRSLR